MNPHCELSTADCVLMASNHSQIKGNPALPYPAGPLRGPGFAIHVVIPQEDSTEFGNHRNGPRPWTCIALCG